MTCLDNFLQVPPGFFKSLHSEPGVGIGGHPEALDLTIQFCQLVEVSLGRAQGRAEGVMSFPQRFDLFQRVAAHRVCQVLLGILKPAVKG